MTSDTATTRRSRRLAFRTALLFGALVALQAPLLYAYVRYDASARTARENADAEKRLVGFLNERKLARADHMRRLACAEDKGAVCWSAAPDAREAREPGAWLALDAELKPCAPTAAEPPRDRELEAEWRNILKELRSRPVAADAPRELALRQYYTRYGAEARLVTVAALERCAGRPTPGGLLVHSEALGALLAGSADPAGASARFRLQDSAPAGLPAHELVGFRPGERFYVSYTAPDAVNPAALTLPAPPPALAAWAVLQILLVTIIFYLFGRGLQTGAEHAAPPTKSSEGPVAPATGPPTDAGVAPVALAPARARPEPQALEPARLRALQDRALDGALVSVEGFDIGGALLPADPPGGDLFFQTRTDDGCTALLFADASGRGAPAALVALHVALFFQKHARSAERAGDILERMNRDFTAVFQASEFLSCAVCRLNPRTLQAEYASAGASDAFYFSASGVEPVRFNPEEPPLGADAAARYSTLSHALKPGDRVALVSDGALLQTNAAGETYGPVRFERWMHAARTRKNAELAAGWLAEAERFRDAVKLQDDLAILCIEARTAVAPDRASPAAADRSAAGDRSSANDVGDSLEGVLARARAAYGAGRYADAVRDYQQVLARDPGHDASRFNLALACFRNGETDAARRALEPYLARYPHSDRARTLERALASSAEPGL